MRIVMFYHTLLSDWNHGNAQFLRGIVDKKRVGEDLLATHLRTSSRRVDDDRQGSGNESS